GSKSSSHRCGMPAAKAIRSGCPDPLSGKGSESLIAPHYQCGQHACCRKKVPSHNDVPVTKSVLPPKGSRSSRAPTLFGCGTWHPLCGGSTGYAREETKGRS